MVVVPYIIIGFFLCCGILVILAVAKKPQNFWFYITLVTVGTAGFSISGLTVVDDYLLLCILVGSSLSMASRHNRFAKSRFVKNPHVTLFLVFLTYMVLQSIRGMLVLGSLTVFRWVVFFLVLSFITVIVDNRKHPVPPVRKTALFLSATLLAYFLAYLVYGLFAEDLLGIDRYDLQYAQTGNPLAIWGTTAYVMFPLAAALPAISVLLMDKSTTYKQVAWITLFVSLIAALYYDSRISVLTIFAFVVVSWISFGLAKSFFITLIMALTLTFFVTVAWEGNRSLEFIISDTFGAGEVWDKGKETQDIDRKVHMEVAFRSISQDPEHFLFGYGFRTSGIIIGPYFADAWNERSKVKYRGSLDNMSTEGLTDFVVGTGLVGLVLLGLNIIVLVKRILQRRRTKIATILLLSASLMVSWMAVINMLDISLFYIAIMPGGLLEQLSESTDRSPNEDIRSVRSRGMVHSPAKLSV